MKWGVPAVSQVPAGEAPMGVLSHRYADGPGETDWVSKQKRDKYGKYGKGTYEEGRGPKGVGGVGANVGLRVI